MAALRMTRRRRGITRKTGVLAASVALASAGLVLPAAAPAHAASGDLTCTASFQFNFDPALAGSTTTARANADAALVNCISPNGQHSDLASATVDATGTATAQEGVLCSLLFTCTPTSGSEPSSTGCRH